MDMNGFELIWVWTDADVPEISGVYAETFDAETLIDAGAIQVVVRHGLSTPEPDDFSATLSATWTDTDVPVIVAYMP